MPCPIMKLPEIGDILTTKEALELCRYFGLDYLIERIESDPEKYKDWKFDGCSGLPNKVMGFFTGCDWKDITYKCCLPHDLCYGYGEPGNDIERKRVDLKFYSDLGSGDQSGYEKMVRLCFSCRCSDRWSGKIRAVIFMGLRS